ncbi:MAG: methyltransferase domain-containing protein [Kofleriaceae bacterium]
MTDTLPHRVRHADAFDAEAPAHDERLHAAARIQPGEHVLDIGCGTGHSTRTAARAAAPGCVLGVDISAPLLEHARATTPLDNVTYEQGDAQIYPFLDGHFDVVISRFGAMFFTDAAAAFTNIARALRPGGRLALLVWQRRELNEWAVAIGDALGMTPTPTMLAAFSLGDDAEARQLLAGAGFEDIQFIDVHEPVYYGRDVTAALTFVGGFLSTQDARDSDQRLRAMLAGHHRATGVYLDSRAWIITASTPRTSQR